MNTMDVANTIVEQLGGRKFIAMTDARRFIGDDTSVCFRLPGAGGFTKHSINYVKITLDPFDTYTMVFKRIHGMNIKTIAEHTDVCFDALQEIFTRETGLAVSL